MKTQITPGVSDSLNKKGLITSLLRHSRVVTSHAKKIIYIPRVNKGTPLTRAAEKKTHMHTFFNCCYIILRKLEFIQLVGIWLAI